MENGRTFYAKLLMFGEYGVTCNSMGLTVPFNQFSGRFNFNIADLVAKESNQHIKELAKHLALLKNKNQLLFDLDLDRFNDDLKEDLFFESSIPQGTGAGSSGALCAAIYDKYAINKIDWNGEVEKNELTELREIFIQMESFFHGVSSGLDPLNCYLGKPLKIESDGTICFTDLPENLEEKDINVFLINTKMTGKTEPLVNWFFDQLRQHRFYKNFNQQFIPANNQCIQSFIDGESEVFYKNLKDLSVYTLENFTPMIPKGFEELWQNGLDSDDYYLKLCGSGGGGFLLGFTKDFAKAKKLMAENDLEIIQFRG